MESSQMKPLQERSKETGGLGR
jgi:hypothetical protein